MKSFLLALQFLTVATVKSGLRADSLDLARSRAWYSVVGGLVGLVLAGAAWVLGFKVPPLALAAVLVVLWGALTRFLHYDGVADTADALVHTTSRERALEIMKDTRLGSFGVAALAGVMLLKFGALASLSGASLWGAVVAAPALGRALAGILAGLMPPARPGVGLGAALAQESTLWPDVMCGACALAIALLAGGLAGAVASLAVLILGLVLALWFRRRIGGVTGDTLGAAIELGEVAALMAWCVVG
ncbi:MAG: adenosylcobinamide-GDP ribazoletransferase [Desulfarculus sp.]|nr:adenosylcobinamide-GDP ribazoletransferase [Pseudomonadota bacterium]MBV1717131.1 adenosylcobinamide-GDP ribazoletransferase [Desulfarculus sp.]MBU4576686.1 adenosylcobinamide-GDP ribazoletransferase [Pseudomonadota bacterium]MBU4598357.1 adenosylcobinamide-GDP ribazoletransferase [Pseudomonadota bacterium]MBV1740355.1 adenosylcobinamide-GDP ribazoletransferase [Desulfarculus sp.]